MKKILLFVVLLMASHLMAQSPKREFRATWLATVWNIDWPKTKVTTTGNTTQIAAQKAELTAILDSLVRANMNAICMQIRPTSDALYNSAYEPWSKVLTGTRGKDPGYDPLAYALEEAHKRGLELHAWINPFRYETSSGSYGNVDLRLNHPEWILDYPQKQDGTNDVSILDPGNPNVRQYIASVIGDIMSKYDIDGVLFDDYFYAYSGTSSTLDSYSQGFWKSPDISLADWRRANIDATIEAVYDTIQAVKSWVRFGVAPFGIWTTSSSVASTYGLTLPSGITGMNAYSQIYCNPIAWLNAGTIDYVSPQLYWTTTSSGQDYDVLCPWWSDVVKTYSDNNASKDFHLYVSQSLSSMEAQSSAPAKAPANNQMEEISQLQGLSWLERAKVPAATAWDQTEIGLQIDRNRSSDQMGAPGSIFYNTTSFKKTGFISYLKTQKFTQKSLPPAMDWKTATTQAVPTNLTLSGTTLTWTHATANRFSVYAYPKGTSNALATSTYLCGISYSKSFDVSDYASDLENTTLAVRAFDRYGNEFDAGFYNAASEEWGDPEDISLVITKKWSKTQAASGYLATGNVNRSMTLYDGKLYIPNSSAGTFSVVDAETGNLQSTQTITTGAFWMHNLRITEDGQMLLGNTGTGSNTLFVKSSDMASGGVSDVSNNSITGFGRSDYFFPYGKFNDETGGFLLALSNTNNKFVKIPYANGTTGTAVVVTHADLPCGISAIAVPADANSFYANSLSAEPTLHSIATGAKIDTFGIAKPTVSGVSGLNVCTLKGHKFMFLPSNQYGAIEVFDITNGLSNAVKMSVSTGALGSTTNSAYTVAICSQSLTDTVMMYVMAPNNGIAAYALTANTITAAANEEMNTEVHIYMHPDGLHAEFIGKQMVGLYHINGMCIDSRISDGAYYYPLKRGAYLLRIGSKTYKVLR